MCKTIKYVGILLFLFFINSASKKESMNELRGKWYGENGSIFDFFSEDSLAVCIPESSGGYYKKYYEYHCNFQQNTFTKKSYLHNKVHTIEYNYLVEGNYLLLLSHKTYIKPNIIDEVGIRTKDKIRHKKEKNNRVKQVIAIPDGFTGIGYISYSNIDVSGTWSCSKIDTVVLPECGCLETNVIINPFCLVRNELQFINSSNNKIIPSYYSKQESSRKELIFSDNNTDSICISIWGFNQTPKCFVKEGCGSELGDNVLMFEVGKLKDIEM